MNDKPIDPPKPDQHALRGAYADALATGIDLRKQRSDIALIASMMTHRDPASNSYATFRAVPKTGVGADGGGAQPASEPKPPETGRCHSDDQAECHPCGPSKTSTTAEAEASPQARKGRISRKRRLPTTVAITKQVEDLVDELRSKASLRWTNDSDGMLGTYSVRATKKPT